MDKRIRIVFDRQKVASDVTRGVVEVIVTLKGRRVYVNTRVKLFDFQWKDGEVVNHQDSRALNATINRVARDCERVLITLEVNGDYLTPTKFRRLLPREADMNKDFMKWLKNRIECRVLKEGTKKGHLVTYRALERFGKFRTFEDLTYENICAFDIFIREEKNEKTNTLGRSQSVVHNYHKRFRSFVSEAYRLGLIKENPYSRFVDKRGKGGRRPHLTKDQVIQLQSLRDKMPDGKEAMYMDFFLFQTFTGMAFSDALGFDYEKHVVTINGNPYIDGQRVKTGSEYVVPLLPYAQKILARTGNKPTVPSIQKYNYFLKGIGAAIGCLFPLTSHVARHTFACTIILGEGVPKEVLQVMMGHSSIKTTEIYAKLPIDFISRNVNQQLFDTWK